MSPQQAKEKILNLLRQKGKETDRNLTKAIGGDEELYLDLKQELILEELAEDYKGVGLVYMEQDEVIDISQKAKKPLKLFISYGHDENKILVDKIVDDLKSRGHKAWIDHNQEKHQGIRPGDNWRREITKGILDSDGVLSFLSKHSTREPGVCLDEIGIAVGVKSAHIQTILVEDENEAKAPPIISHVQWHDMRHWKEVYEKGGEEWKNWYHQHLKEIIRVVESDQTVRFAGEIAELEEQLDPISFDARLEQLLRNPFVGREWLTDAIEKWRVDDPESRVFWLVGGPGIGKSAFATNYAHFGKDKVIGLFLCQWNMPGMKNPTIIIKTLAFQLATRLPDFRLFLLDIIKNKALSELSDFELFNTLIADPLSRAIKGGRERFIIVIDALDEAASGEENVLAQVIGQHGGRLPQEVGILVTSRLESNVIRHLQGLNPYKLDADRPENKKDIELYIQSRLSQELSSRNDPEQLLNIILDKSENNFLYVERFYDDVINGNLSLDDPNSFPQGLSGLLYGYCQRQFPDLEKYKSLYRDPIRCILASDKVPLPVVVLKSIFNWNEEELRELIRDLGSLFVTPKVDGTEVIQPYHKSLIDLLTDHKLSHDYFVELKQGHQLLAVHQWAIYQSGEYRNDNYLLKTFPHHLIHSQEWDQLEEILTDLMFLDAKVAAGIVFELNEDYIEALQYLPENQENIKEEKERQARLDKYAEDLISYAKGEIEELNIPESITPLPEEEIQKEIDRIIENPTRLDKIKAFGQFVKSRLYALEAWASIPYHTIQHAANSAANGPVRNKVMNYIKNNNDKIAKNISLIKLNSWLSIFNPISNTDKLFRGHSRSIEDIALSADSRKLISTSKDHTVRLWDIPSNRTQIINQYPKIIRNVSINANGSRAVLAGDYRMMYCLDMNNLQILSTFHLEGHNDYVTSISLNPSDSTIALSSSIYDRTCRIWNIKTRQNKIIHKHIINFPKSKNVDISADGKWGFIITRENIYVAKLDQDFTLMSLQVCKINMTNDPLDISSSANGGKLIWTDGRSLLYILNMDTKEFLNLPVKYSQNVSISADGKIAVSSDGASITVVNTEYSTIIKKLFIPEASILRIKLSPDAKYAIIGKINGDITMIDIESGINNEFKDFQFGSYIDSVNLNLTSEILIIKRDGNTAEIRDLSANIIKNFDLKNIIYFDGTTYIKRSTDYNSLQIYDVESMELIRKIKINTEIEKASIDRSSGIIAYASAVDHTIHALNFNTNTSLAIFEGITKEDKSQAIKEYGRKGSLRSLKSTRELGHSSRIRNISIEKDGELLLSCDKKYIRLWDVKNQKTINHFYSSGKLSNSGITCAILVHNRNELIAGLTDGTIIIWDINSKKPIHTIDAHGDANIFHSVTGLQFEPNDELIISSGTDKTIKIWDSKTRKCIQVYNVSSAVKDIDLKENLLAYGTSTGEIGVLQIKWI